MTTLFTVPISSTGGSITCTNLSTAKEHETIYVLTFTSPPDNRLTPIFIDALLLALDIIEHRYPKGVVVTTSGIAKFYSNGLDLELVAETEGFLENWLWRLFRRLLTYPMPTVCLLNGHAFAGGFMLAMYHDYRIMNPDRGFLCVNELEFGVPLQTPMMAIFREKLTPVTFRSVVLEAHRFGGRNALQAGIVDAVGGAEETLALIQTRKLQTKAATGIYGTMKEEMYARVLSGLDDHAGNLQWREKVEDKNQAVQKRGLNDVEQFEKNGKSKL
ncbi:Crotonase core [Penicillium cf. griseofulvum]|uniref:Crotonase core n=1 Tax=Penicillium cf. griseofulvum TaxID=2972120 RepID=A0A9W9J539_9EURO|nr:Crotonase core [Penicillium cf. griseofulvum]